MKKAKKMLMITAVELLAAEKLLKEKKKEAHKAKAKLEKINAKRAIKLLEKTKKNIEDHRELLEAEI
jgi:hypothetical protein